MHMHMHMHAHVAIAISRSQAIIYIPPYLWQIDAQHIRGCSVHVVNCALESSSFNKNLFNFDKVK